MHLAPAGFTYMEDLDRAGGVYAVMKELADAGLLHTNCITCTGKTVGKTSPMPTIWTRRSSASGQSLYGRQHLCPLRQLGPRRLRGQAGRRCPRDDAAHRSRPGL